MTDEEKQQALESIALIKELVLQTKRRVGFHGGGWIAMIWGVFCLIGVAGQRICIPNGALIGVWWTGLAVLAGWASALVGRRCSKDQPIRAGGGYLRYFLGFWIPLMVLGYTLALFIVLNPAISKSYIAVVMLLVVSAGYLIMGFLFYREILYLGAIGYVATIVCAVYVLEYSDLILGALFGLGLIVTGWIINKRWKTI